MATILAVDESAFIRQMVSFTLKSSGYSVVEAVDGMDALDKANAQAFDCVVTDVNMPNKDGISLIKDLRALPNYRFIPLLMLTTESGKVSACFGFVYWRITNSVARRFR